MQKFILEIKPRTVGVRKPKTRRLPPSLNARMHWAVRAKWNQEFKDQVMWLCQIQKVPACQKIKIEIKNFAIKPPDRDNLVTSLKPLIDGIVAAGVVPDDKEQYVDLKMPKNFRVRHRVDEKFLLIITIKK